MRQILTQLGLSLIACWCFAQPLKPTFKPMNVGDIEFDSKIDHPDFKLCDSTKIYQYYNFGTSYKGEKSALKDTLLSMFTMNEKFKQVNGIITIRFVVNCKGQTDRFRVKQIDKDYKEAKFDKELVRHLLDITKRTNGWMPGISEGKPIDSYVHINFIFENGNLKYITP